VLDSVVQALFCEVLSSWYRVPLLSILQCHYSDGSREPAACFKTLLIWAVIHHKDPSSAGYKKSALSCYVGCKEFTFYSLIADFMAVNHNVIAI